MFGLLTDNDQVLVCLDASQARGFLTCYDGKPAFALLNTERGGKHTVRGAVSAAPSVLLSQYAFLVFNCSGTHLGVPTCRRVLLVSLEDYT